MKKYKIERMIENDESTSYIVRLYSETKRGFNIQRVFKGTRKECMVYINEKKNEKFC